MQHIYDAVLEEYFTPAGRLALDTQTAYVIALRYGVYRKKEKLLEQFRKRLKKDDFKLRSGFVGAPLLCQTLRENGMEDLAWQFLLNEEYPGWLYCVNLGATTIWERWNSIQPDGRISENGMNSLNHYSYGSVAQFLYEDVSGIRCAEPGYRKYALPHASMPGCAMSGHPMILPVENMCPNGRYGRTEQYGSTAKYHSGAVRF